MMPQVIREEVARLLNAFPNEYAITLKYAAGPIGMEKIRRDLNALRARVDRQHLGRHYHNLADRCSYWAVGEMLDVLPHVHTAWRFSSRAHGMAMIRLLHGGIWETVFAPGGGTHDLQVYDPTAFLHGGGWAGYAVKALTTMDNIILSEGLEIVHRAT